MSITGRTEEVKTLLDAIESPASEFVAIYGRRRVGKTFLVRETYAPCIRFSFTGVQHASLKDQLGHFITALSKVSRLKKDTTVTSWLNAFFLLSDYLRSIKDNRKKVVFIDELPWLDTPKSNFLRSLDWFWNSFASARNDIVLVVCGSASSWIINKIFRDRGGLHNRVTKRIMLMPFTLQETEAFLRARRIRLNRPQITELYMAMGGVPYYLNEIKRGESSVQCINRVCFKKNGLLYSEFDNLYASLFNNFEKHLKIVKALAGAHYGLTRDEIVVRAKLVSGGAVTAVLEELIQSGFVDEMQAMVNGRKKIVYRLCDHYTLFYLRYIQPHAGGGSGAWASLAQQQGYASWCGYAFENICAGHIEPIKKALGIAAVYARVSTWRSTGAQVDLVIDRSDRITHLCEIKYHGKPVVVNHAFVQKLEKRRLAYLMTQKKKPVIFHTLIAANGATGGSYLGAHIENVITLDDLFAPFSF